MAPVDETLSVEDIAAAQASLRNLMTGHWGARALHTAVALNVFETLDGRPLKSPDLASQLGVDGRACEMLLNALVALGLLEKDDGSYKNSAVSQVLLTPSSEFNQSGLVAMFGREFEAWRELEAAIRKGGPAGFLTSHDTDRVRATRDAAVVTAPLVLKKVDLSRVKRVLDVGGGAGTYSIALAKARPEAQITIVETLQSSLVTREHLEAAGLSDRVRVETGDLQTVDFGKDCYELVLLSNVLNLNSIEQCRGLLKKAFEAIVSEGQCIVNEMLLRDDKTGPLPSTLFSLHTLLQTDGGRAYSGWEITDYMQSEGFIRVQIVPMDPSPLSLVVGTRP